MNGNNPDENFLGANFPGGKFSRGEGLMGGNFSGGHSPGGRDFHRPFSSYNVSILTVQKITNKYNKTFNKNICTLNS